MASPSGSVSWTPAPGRHPVNIGPSLGKALKARKLKASPAGMPPAKRSNLPERDFYSFQFNFKPPSIDTTKPASIEIQRSADNTKVVAEYPSAQPGEAHIFQGAERSAKEVDCVLIYDEDTGTYSLEKLDSFVTLHYDRKTTISPRPSESPQKKETVQKKEKKAKSTPAAASKSVSSEEPIQKKEKKAKPIPPPPAASKSVSSEEPIQKKEKKPKPIPAAAASKSVLSEEPIQKKAKPIPAAASNSVSYADEEVIEFGRPAKRPRPSTPQRSLLPPTPPATVTLSLPGGSSSFAPPPPPGSHNSKSTANSSRNIPPPAVPAALSLPTSGPNSPPMMGQYESDEEEDWDEVSTANLASASLAPSNSNSNVGDPAAFELALEQDIFGDVFEEVDGDVEGQATGQPSVGDGEEEEIDINAFEQELNEQMEVVEDSDDDVFGGVAVESEPDLQGGTRQPISLNRLASGGAVEMSEEDYSSSDESD